MADVIIGNDHGGLRLKKYIVKLLQENGVDYEDIGCDSEDIVRYPYYAAKVASAVSEGRCKRGILICSTGIGMSIAANKYPGVRASLCSTSYDARMTRQHNDSNVLCLGGKTIGEAVALDIVKTWLSESYIGGRHDISLGLIRDIEKTNLTNQIWEKDIPEIQ